MMKAPIYRIGRGLALLLILSTLLWQCTAAGEGESRSTSLFEQYYEPYPAHAEIVGGGEDEERETWNRAGKLYGEGDYVGAIEGYKLALENERPPDATVNFYLGASYLQLSPARPKEAIAHFNAVIDERKGKYYEAARWYRALCYLKREQVAETRIMLVRIQQEEDEYKKAEVNKLLSQLPAE